MTAFDPAHPDWPRCIDRLYDAVGQEQQLAQALGDFRPFVDAFGVTFLTVPDMRHPGTVHTGAVGLSALSLLQYHSHFNQHDVWVHAAVRRPDFGEGAVLCGTALVPPAQLRQSYYWRGFLQPHGVGDVLAGVVEAPSAQGPASFISFYRPTDAPPFSEAQRPVLAALLPHLRRVLRLHRRVAPALALGQTLQDLVQRLALPVLLLAADGRLVDHNPAAGALLRGPSAWLRLRGQTLQMAQGQAWSDLAAPLAALPERGSLQLGIVARTGAGPRWTCTWCRVRPPM